MAASSHACTCPCCNTMLGGAKGTMVLISCVMFRPGIPSVDTGRTIPISFNDHIHTVTVLTFLYFFSKIFPKVQSARCSSQVGDVLIKLEMLSALSRKN